VHVIRLVLGVTLAAVAVAGSSIDAGALGASRAQHPAPQPTPTSRLLHRDVLINADIWTRQPQMLAAGLGFTGIIGVPGLSTSDLAASEARVRAAGGTWNRVSCAPGETPALSAYTSASTPKQVALAYGYPAIGLDGLPVEFSWPVRPSTLDPSDFRVTLSNGRTVTPRLASIYPNEAYNERSTVVLFGQFGDRLAPPHPDALYPVKTAVVTGATILQLVGPRDRLVSAVGMSATSSTTPYQHNRQPSQWTGPHLVAAKLSRMSTRGDGAPPAFRGVLPNDGVALYGKAAKFRLRLLTSGGFSPDGVQALLPTDFSRFFRLHADGVDGRTVLLTRTDVNYHLPGGIVRILGLADLGRKQSVYGECYQEDHNNEIDIILDGDEAAVSRITAVEIPAVGRYRPFYNPGGPGNDPTKGVPYTSPGPPQVQPVIDALGDPMTVTFIR
jgi:hypothetical protein